MSWQRLTVPNSGWSHVWEPPDVPLPDDLLERVYLYRQSQG